MALLLAVAIATAVLVPAARSYAQPSLQESAAVECAPIEPVALPFLEAIEAATPFASPIASPIASPVASPAEDPALTALRNDLDLVVRTVAACQSTGRVRGLTRFVTDSFLGDYYAGGGRLTAEEFVAFAPNLPRVRVNIQDVSAVTFDPEGRATAEVTSIVGRQLLRATWSFEFVSELEGDQTGTETAFGQWLASGITALKPEPPDGASRIRFRLVDNEYRPATANVEGPDVVIAASNDGEDDHELLVLRLRDGATTQSLLAATGPELPPGVTFIGQVTVPAGENGTLILVGLSEGTYAIVDLLVDENGTPHLALGMEATLIVE